MKVVKLELGGELKEFPLGVSILLYGSVGSGKTTFSMTLAKEFLAEGLPCIWVCLDDSPRSIKEKLEYFKVDYEKYQNENMMRFIDVYSEQVTGTKLDDPYIINCSSAFNLNELNRALMQALSQVSGQGIVIFDSVSTLLLYNKRGTCEEFLKVHMSRITSAGFTGFFIMQRDLHNPQTEETLKMMSDSVLEFGFAKNGRQIGVSKLPLGLGGDWIESSLFSWQQPQGQVVVTQPSSSNRKFMDSGGYIEDIREGVAEGIKGALEEIREMDENRDRTRDSYSGDRYAGDDGGVDNTQRRDDSGYRRQDRGERDDSGYRRQDRGERDDNESRGGGRYVSGREDFAEDMARAFERGFGNIKNIKLEAPGLKELRIENMVSEKLEGELKSILSEQKSLVNSVKSHDLKTQASRQKLDHLSNRELQTAEDLSHLSEQNKTLLSVVSEKRTFIESLEEDLRKAKDEYHKALESLELAKKRADAIILRKQSLEDKIQDLVESPGNLNLDLKPILDGIIGKADAHVNSAKEDVAKILLKITEVTAEITKMETDMIENSRRREHMEYELDNVRSEKTQVESEIEHISAARAETESKLSGISDKKQMLEEQLRKLMEEST